MKKYWIPLSGHSMGPFLKNADNILIEQVLIESLDRGDIILFLDQQSKELTLHRLVQFPLKTKGDFSLSFEDNPQGNFIGKAIGYNRDGHYRQLPGSGFRFNKIVLYFSKKRTKGYFVRKYAFTCLFILAKVFEFCSGKARICHNEEQSLSDL